MEGPHPHQIYAIHLYGLIGHVLLFMQHGASVLQAMGYSGPIHIDVTLASLLGVPWIYGDSGIFTKSGSEIDNEVTFSIETTTEFLKNPFDIAMDVMRVISFAMNWPDLLDTPQKQKDMLLMGRKYNSW